VVSVAPDRLRREPLRDTCRSAFAALANASLQVTGFGGPEVLDVVDLPAPATRDGEQLYEVSAAGINYADTHHSPS
jgi:hypothetical protein